MKNINDLAREKCSIIIFSNKYVTAGQLLWTAQIEREADGTNIKVTKNGPSMQLALDEALAAWHRATSPFVEFAGPQLEYHEDNRPLDEDGIPF